MAGRTFAIGDLHGEPDALDVLLSRLPPLDASDTVVLLGDYLDRGPRSADAVERVRQLPARLPAKVVALRGNHEDAWLRVIDDGGCFGFTSPPQNGCLSCMRSFLADGLELAEEEALLLLHSGGFFPPDVVEWMRSLPHWYEDDNGLYVHAGLPERPDGSGFQHPSEVEEPRRLLWLRSRSFFTSYAGKRVVCGHTVTETLPPELSHYTPEDPADLFWAGGSAYLIDTGCGKGGFLTALELPSRQVYESR